jgi:hypothetical protein
LAYHRFKIAQIVTSRAPDSPPGPYVIVRLLPHIDGEPQYWVASMIDGEQSAIPESQIVLVPNEETRGTVSSRFSLSMHTDDEPPLDHELFAASHQ